MVSGGCSSKLCTMVQEKSAAVLLRSLVFLIVEILKLCTHKLDLVALRVFVILHSLSIKYILLLS